MTFFAVQKCKGYVIYPHSPYYLYSKADEKSFSPVIKRWKYREDVTWSSSTTTTTRETETCPNGIDITSNPMFAVGSDNVSRNSSPSPLPSPKVATKNRHETSASDESKLPLSSENSNASLQKAGSLISMTSQVSFFLMEFEGFQIQVL